jgi:hypothetical protein
VLGGLVFGGYCDFAGFLVFSKPRKRAKRSMTVEVRVAAGRWVYVQGGRAKRSMTVRGTQHDGWGDAA